MSLSPETEEVLRRARLSTAMAPEQRRRLKSRIVARIAATGTLLVAGDAAARGGFALWSGALGTTAKSVTAIALVASLGAGGYVAARAVQRSRAQLAPSAHQEPEPSRRIEPVAPPAMPEPAIAPVAAASPQDAPAKPSSRTAARGTGAGAVAADAPNTLLEETKLLQDADHALRTGNTDRAMALLDQHAAQYPKSQFAPERAAERMVGLCQSGRADTAAGQRFLASHPNSPLGARIKQACRIGTP